MTTHARPAAAQSARTAEARTALIRAEVAQRLDDSRRALGRSFDCLVAMAGDRADGRATYPPESS